jgi:hypothetical protein
MLLACMAPFDRLQIRSRTYAYSEAVLISFTKLVPYLHEMFVFGLRKYQDKHLTNGEITTIVSFKLPKTVSNTAHAVRGPMTNQA